MSKKDETQMKIEVEKSYEELRKEHSAEIAKARQFFKENKEDWTDQKNEEFDNMMNNAEALKKALDTSNKRIFLDAGLNDSEQRLVKASFENQTVTLFPARKSISAEVGSVRNGFGHVVRAMVAGRDASGLPPEIRSAMSESVGTSGGYRVPVQLAADVLDLARARSVIMQAGAQTATMTTNELTMTRLMSDPTISIKPENHEFAETDFSIGAVVFRPFLFGCLLKMSRELAEDGINIVATAEDVMSKALANAFDRYGLVGDGSNEPLGICVDPTISDTAGIGVVEWNDLSTAATSMRSENYDPRTFVMHPSVHDKLFDSYSTNFGWIDAPPSIRGSQFLHTTNMPVGNIVVGDFSKMVVALRQGMLIESTNSAGDSFARHQVWLKITMRGDIGQLRPNAFRRLSGVQIA